MVRAKRHVFHSSLTKSGWEVKRDGKTISRHRTQANAEAAVIEAARAVYDDGGLSQVVFHKSDGVISRGRTYVEDVENRPG